MKTNFLTTFFLLISVLAISQNQYRQILHGKVINNSFTIDNGHVLNITANSKTTIDKEGFFDIEAKSDDVLVISGFQFQPEKKALREQDFQPKILLIEVVPANNQLKELIINKEKATGFDSGKIVEYQYFDDTKSNPENTVMYSDQTIKYGMDFVKIFKKVKTALESNKSEKEIPTSDIAFVEYALLNFSSDFYTKELELKKDEVELFLMFCANDPEAQKHLNPDEMFQLMDFMVNKNVEFKKIRTTIK